MISLLLITNELQKITSGYRTRHPSSWKTAVSISVVIVLNGFVIQYFLKT